MLPYYCSEWPVFSSIMQQNALYRLHHTDNLFKIVSKISWWYNLHVTQENVHFFIHHKTKMRRDACVEPHINEHNRILLPY